MIHKSLRHFSSQLWCLLVAAYLTGIANVILQRRLTLEQLINQYVVLKILLWCRSGDQFPPLLRNNAYKL